MAYHEDTPSRHYTSLSDGMAGPYDTQGEPQNTLRSSLRKSSPSVDLSSQYGTQGPSDNNADLSFFDPTSSNDASERFRSFESMIDDYVKEPDQSFGQYTHSNTSESYANFEATDALNVDHPQLEASLTCALPTPSAEPVDANAIDQFTSFDTFDLSADFKVPDASNVGHPQMDTSLNCALPTPSAEPVDLNAHEAPLLTASGQNDLEQNDVDPLYIPYFRMVSEALRQTQKDFIDTTFNSLEEAREKAKSRRTGDLPRKLDDTIPQTIEQKRAIVEKLRNCMYLTDKAQDNPRPIEQWKHNAPARDIVELACWEILEAAIEHDKNGPLTEKENKYTGSFAHRMAHIMLGLETSKSFCNQVLEPRKMDLVVDNPPERLKSICSNLKCNNKKADKLKKVAETEAKEKEAASASSSVQSRSQAAETDANRAGPVDRPLIAFEDSHGLQPGQDNNPASMQAYQLQGMPGTDGSQPVRNSSLQDQQNINTVASTTGNPKNGNQKPKSRRATRQHRKASQKDTSQLMTSQQNSIQNQGDGLTTSIHMLPQNSETSAAIHYPVNQSLNANRHPMQTLGPDASGLTYAPAPGHQPSGPQMGHVNQLMNGSQHFMPTPGYNGIYTSTTPQMGNQINFQNPMEPGSAATFGTMLHPNNNYFVHQPQPHNHQALDPSSVVGNRDSHRYSTKTQDCQNFQPGFQAPVQPPASASAPLDFMQLPPEMYSSNADGNIVMPDEASTHGLPSNPFNAYADGNVVIPEEASAHGLPLDPTVSIPRQTQEENVTPNGSPEKRTFDEFVDFDYAPSPTKRICTAQTWL